MACGVSRLAHVNECEGADASVPGDCQKRSSRTGGFREWRQTKTINGTGQWIETLSLCRIIRIRQRSFFSNLRVEISELNNLG